MYNPPTRLGGRQDRTVDEQASHTDAAFGAERLRDLMAARLREHASGKVEAHRHSISGAGAFDQHFEAPFVLGSGERTGRLADIDHMLKALEAVGFAS